MRGPVALLALYGTVAACLAARAFGKRFPVGRPAMAREAIRANVCRVMFFQHVLLDHAINGHGAFIARTHHAHNTRHVHGRRVFIESDHHRPRPFERRNSRLAIQTTTRFQLESFSELGLLRLRLVLDPCPESKRDDTRRLGRCHFGFSDGCGQCHVESGRLVAVTRGVEEGRQ